MKNLVYLCCFLNKNYIRFFELLFASIALFSKKSLATTDILVITQEDFVEEIQQKALKYGIQVYFQVLEKPYNVFISTVLRYEIFAWDKIHDYEKLLYIDTDILINGELSEVFSLATDPTKLYTFREGPISHDFWGGNEIFDFQDKDKEIDPSTIGFCTGVMLFYKNDVIQKIFLLAKNYMYEKLQVPGTRIPICYDQPYINYICAKYKLNENDSLGTKCVNRAFEILDGYVVYHFPATRYSGKYKNMLIMLIEMIKSVEESPIKATVEAAIETENVFLMNYDENAEVYKKY